MTLMCDRKVSFGTKERVHTHVAPEGEGEGEQPPGGIAAAAPHSVKPVHACGAHQQHQHHHHACSWGRRRCALLFWTAIVLVVLGQVAWRRRPSGVREAERHGSSPPHVPAPAPGARALGTQPPTGLGPAQIGSLVTDTASFSNRLHGVWFKVSKAELVGLAGPQAAEAQGTLPHLYFECRLRSPSVVLLCSATHAEDQPGGGVLYRVASQRVPETGHYHLQLVVAQVGRSGAFPEGRVAKQYVNVTCSTGPALLIERTPEGEALDAGLGPALSGDGYYRRTPAGDEWRSGAVAAPRKQARFDLRGCLLAADLILVGDSHMRGWRDVLGIAQGLMEGPQSTVDAVLKPSRYGSVTYLRGESMVFTQKVASSKLLQELRGGWTHAEHQLVQLREFLSERQSTQGGNRRAVVAMNFGSWDLRDVGLEEYCARIEGLQERMEKFGLFDSGLGQVAWVWRSIPAYSYGGKMWRDSDLRTNEKIAMSNECAARILASPTWSHHDTFMYTRPVFDEPCDTHHYLCPLYPSVARVYGKRACPWILAGDTQPVSTGCSGKADIQAFLQKHVCPSGGG